MYHSSSWWFSSPLIVGWSIVLIALAIWSLVWKGRALWKAARLGHLGWFVALLIINTAGILDILYIYVFSKPKMSKNSDSSTHSGSAMPPHHHDQTPMVKSDESMPSGQTS
jgi:hypothetical protein